MKCVNDYQLPDELVQQLHSLSHAVRLPWQQVLADALSEYRSMMGVLPPEEESAALDDVPCDKGMTVGQEDPLTA